ncbi:MAG TPA: HlyD family efflux transporter periplasmic adaptor subunit [Paenalcaligenes sp.]|nr:HlyD family efflux transporter periplasmic adaptor subunit [Paenalcaligenes sp.]
MAQKKRNINWIYILLGAFIFLGVGAWWWHEYGHSEDERFAMSNGRLEATEIDVAAKMSGRLKEVLVQEGDLVQADEIVAQMDPRSLNAQLAQAQAQKAQAESAVEAARAQVAQRQADKAMAEATLVQRESELSLAEKTWQRSQKLAAERAISAQQLDNDHTRFLNAQAMLQVAKAQINAIQAGVQAAEAEVAQAQANIKAAQAAIDNLESEIEDLVLRAPRTARVQHRIAQPGEVLGNGGKVANLVDLADVYMTVFLTEREAGRVPLGAEARIILDALPQYVIPAEVSFVSSVAQFTPKSVETRDERQKLMFRTKVRIDPALLNQYIEYVKTGVPGVAYIRLDPEAEWPADLKVQLPDSAAANNTASTQ